MSSLTSKSVKVVQQALEEKGLSTVQIKEFPEGTRTCADAALAIGCTVSQIAKSLLFKTETTGRPILVLASGSNRVNEEKVGTYVGEKLVKASADFTKETTGFAVGGIPPLGHKQLVETYLDEDLLKHEELWAAGGTPTTVFKLTPSELLRIAAHGKLVSIK